MSDAGAEGTVTTVQIGGSVGFFAGARGLPPGLDEEQLAWAAETAIGRALGAPLPVLYARQLHGALSFTYGAEARLSAGPHLVGGCDALITAEPGVALLVRTADCLPIVLAGPGIAAIVHAGWRGLAADVLGAVVRRIEIEFGIAAARLAAVLGVGVGPCHYEVGDEVVRSLAARSSSAADWRREQRVDLRAWAVGRLWELGLEPGAITVLPGCTACDPGFHSFRRDGDLAGRQWSAVVLRETATG